jgi:cell wall-associated NlpC family hydrolase
MRRRTLLAGTAGALALVWWYGSGHGGSAQLADRSTGGQPRVVAAVTGYARAQAGKPYQWGAAGPDAFDCSGLVFAAYAAAGVAIPRTSQEQWAAGPRVTLPQPGDLVFFPGADGSWSAPGHVGLVTGPHQMIQAYAPGVPIGTYPFGITGALDGTGPGTIVGFTRPWESGRRPS